MEQTDRSWRGEGWKDWKRLAKEHICIYAEPMDTDNSVVKAREGAKVGQRGTKRGIGDICNSVCNKK